MYRGFTMYVLKFAFRLHTRPRRALTPGAMFSIPGKTDPSRHLSIGAASRSSSGSPEAGLHPSERIFTRFLPLPILRPTIPNVRPEPRSLCTPLHGREVGLGKYRHLLSEMQRTEEFYPSQRVEIHRDEDFEGAEGSDQVGTNDGGG